MDPKNALEANQRFYDAFNKSNIELMKNIWLDDSASQCIHPGWNVLTGFESIILSWQKIFSAEQDLEIKLSHVKLTTSEKLAWVTCQENLFSISTSGVLYPRSTLPICSNKLMANGKWFFIMHHQ